MVSESLQAKLDALPTKPGVYLMRDARQRVIYVGKANSLRARVRSYFHRSADHTAKTRRLVGELTDLEVIVTDSELEALILEATLIKRYRPRFNVRLRDDKQYPYIKVDWADPFPRVHTTRQILRDGGRYYGPYTSSQAVAQTLDALRKLFPYRTCTREITGQDRRSCLYYHIRRCAGPCIGAASQAEYREIVAGVCLFLEGHTEALLSDLQRKMAAASEALQFERAALYRDQIKAIETVSERQKVVSTALADQDVVAFARDNGQACVHVFFVRNGKLLGREYFLLEGADDEPDEAVMSSFLKQFYNEATHIPREILLSECVTEALVIEQWLRERRGRKVALRVPRRGQPRKLVEMARENAVETLNMLRAEWAAQTSNVTQALAELQAALGLPEPPTRIEAYDISNIQGTSATGSMVVFVKGLPRKSEYRRFRIRTVEGANDYAMMKEVLTRRLQRAVEAAEPAQADAPGARKDKDWKALPDLVLVDGGQGQLGVALEVLDELHLRDQMQVAALAKQHEELFLPQTEAPLRLPEGSPGLFLLQRIRDEAHRFAVTYHRALRARRTLISQLEDVPGIGPQKRKQLLRQFGSLEAIRQLPEEELAKAPGITPTLARKIKETIG
ncbi:MAG: excinuclease ABC subunit UvrC [Chloroflexi bacterium]|nr:excinuclease ABC subunit UvrC [Chloroflexota bacterium]